MTQTIKIGIVGGGLVGSLMSIYLARRGYKVVVFERRPDIRLQSADAGRSINLALSSRGLLALEEVGLSAEVRELMIPMHGRMMHDISGNLTFQPYGRQGQFINSVSRGELNAMLMSAAEQCGVEYRFEHRCEHVDLQNSTVSFLTGKNNTRSDHHFDQIIGADGAFSRVRASMQVTDRFNYTQHYIEHGYKELHIPAGSGSTFSMERNALHIWPRESFMMIALPNPDGSFTCTLFLPFEGPVSFGSLESDGAIRSFFQCTFPDAVHFMPSLLEDFRCNPTSSLVTTKCFPWSKNNTLLIGDAAHAVVPFYGQGMNAGFEDCRILDDLLDEHEDDWSIVMPMFQELRKPDADAVAQLALDNFIEMRDLVADQEFLLRKKIEARLHEQFPERWIPLYSMVTFSPEIRYSNAYATGQRQKMIMDGIMRRPGIEKDWENLDLKSIVDEL